MEADKESAVFAGIVAWAKNSYGNIDLAVK
jgi:hypothetical protein